MKIKQCTIELVMKDDGAPVWDFQVPPRAPGVPAELLDVGYDVKDNGLQGKARKVHIVTELVFAIDPDLAPEWRRVALLTRGAVIPEELAQVAIHLGTYRHPANNSPISVFEFPWSPSIDDAEPAVGPDVLAAIAAVDAERNYIDQPTLTGSPSLSVVPDNNEQENPQ